MLRAPTVRTGQRLTADLWNELARAVNSGLAAPRDLTRGVTADEVSNVVLQGVEKTVVAERVYDPNDETVYVDVDRYTSHTVLDSRTGQKITTEYV